jgi:hypothetical protein
VDRLRPVPPEIALITGDAVHNLRSALDHLIRQLLIANRKDPEEYPRSAFPVWRSEADYEAGRPGDAEGISKPALDILDRLKPYKGGNDALWRLRQLDVVDKHRLLLAVGSANTNLIIDSRKLMISTHPGHDWLKKGPGVRAAYKAAEPTVITKEGAIFRTAPLGHEPEDYVEFPLDVALNEPTVGKPEPLVPAIHELVRFTDEIVGLFEPLILESI